MPVYSPIMSSVPGLKIMSSYEGKIDQVRYTVTEGQILTMNGSKVKINEKSVTVPMDTAVYWSPDSGGGNGNKKAIAIKAEALNEGIKVAEQTMSIKADGLNYTVRENPNVLTDVK